MTDDFASDSDAEATPTDPLVAEIGRSLVERTLAREGLSIVAEHAPDLAARIEDDAASLRRFGAEIRPLVEFDEIPAKAVSDRWRELAIRQVPTPQLLAVAAKADVGN